MTTMQNRKAEKSLFVERMGRIHTRSMLEISTLVLKIANPNACKGKKRKTRNKHSFLRISKRRFTGV